MTEGISYKAILSWAIVGVMARQSHLQAIVMVNHRNHKERKLICKENSRIEHIYTRTICTKKTSLSGLLFFTNNWPFHPHIPALCQRMRKVHYKPTWTRGNIAKSRRLGWSVAWILNIKKSACYTSIS